MERKSLYDLATYNSMIERINRLSVESQPGWGQMNVGQMLAHCAEIQDVSNGKPLKGTPWFVKLIGGTIKKTVLADKPFPKNIRTHPQYIMTGPEDFETQKSRLLLSLKTMIALGKTTSRHPIFGKMTPEEKGWGMYKHLDHHLTQFGV
ncbi:MAG: DUF1569 domain-containing protein [Bacteroidetes bacterium]|nr:DUF1569 domain-containing protein [Bacteroidota bacterium]